MIDIHTHILPYLDDGAQDKATSKILLQEERKQGVRCVVFTPHYYGRKYSPQTFLERRKASVAKIEDILPENMEIRLGAEVYFSGVNVPRYDELCSLAIEGTKCVLIELPFTMKWGKDLVDMVSDFAIETGYTPIIAHVERYDEVRKKPSIINDFIESGCLIQVNASSFSEKQNKSFAFALLRHGLVHCIGSDAHDDDLRKPCLAEAKAAFEKSGFLEEWEEIQTIMRKILSGEKIEAVSYAPIKKFFGFYR